jgi:hypothetical protein
MIIHLGMTTVAVNWRSRVGVAAAIVSGLLLGDTLAANTAIVFGGIKGINALRSIVLTTGAYFNVGLSFAPAWALLDCSAEPIWWKRVVTAIYQSVRTLATVGPEGNVTQWWGKLITTLEVLVGVYFLATILATYVTLAGNRER